MQNVFFHTVCIICNYFPIQIFQIAAHLVYWGKAIIIYPLCENNVYMLSPHANISLWVFLLFAGISYDWLVFIAHLVLSVLECFLKK